MESNLEAEQPRQINLLAVSFAYPPLAYPRSIQVARLIKFLDASTVLVCGDEEDMRKDVTIEPDAESLLKNCLRVPFDVSRRTKYADRLFYRFHLSQWKSRNMAPDKYRTWKSAAVKAIEDFMQVKSYEPDALVTFGQPFTDHLVGLELKRRYGLPWLAHFSDPWVDNPFNDYDEHTKKLNLILEREVVEATDMLAFTSQETVDLVMAKYPPEWKSKTRILPQSFDPALFEVEPARNAKLVIRYIGNFYGHRTPAPLIETLRLMLKTGAELLDGVKFELVGLVEAEMLNDGGGNGLPDGLLRVHPPVDYHESLRQMTGADGLLVIDAPAELSVFLPSKLIDYVGAGRPVLGMTPPGAAASLIRELGGTIADSSDIAEMAAALKNFIVLLRQRRATPDSKPWGTPGVRDRYDASRVAEKFGEMLEEMLSKY